MTDQDFAFICKLVQQRSAIVLEDGKQYLVESRLTPIVRGMNLGSIKELVERLRADPSNGLHTQIVEAMTTNETSFFRDHQPFEALRMAVLPDLIRRRSEERRLLQWPGTVQYRSPGAHVFSRTGELEDFAAGQ